MKTPKEDVDRGYAWVVLAACFAIEVLYGALICSVGVITPAILEEIDGDLVKVSWIGSTLLGTFTMCGPFIGMVEGRLGHRLASFVGGILILLGLTSASFCRTVTGLILTFGVITGLGCGLAANVSGVAPGDYFNKRLPAAYGICMSGGALGLLVVGPLTIFLLDLYTLSGTLLILGAIGFHVCSAGVLIRPSSTLKPEKSISVQPDCEDGTEECVDAPQDPAELNCVPKTDDPCAQNETTVTVFLQGDDDRHTCSQTDDNEDTDVRSPDSGFITKEDNFRAANTTVAPLLEQNSRSPKKDSWCGAIRESVTLFGANGFFLYLLSVLFWSLSEATCMVHLPNYAEYKGSTPAQSASLFTGMGVSALFSGMLAGFASSDKSIGNILLHVGLQGMSGISIMILPVLSHTYHLQMVACVLYGTYSQGPYTLVSPICIELIGRSKLAVAYGMWSFVLGIGLMFGPPIASLIYESSGDYDNTFIFAGCCNLASAVFAMCIPLCKRNI
ncbi:monocarboxylate transporter 12-like [Haliotis rufescens]|uniref:monocarboxylate transporter 12-like n=1 Tax=Haliotis rufescens TaxID=6454 RepID=UPI00201F3EEB|nr:monocarboxylate transporter 12-like [Haliotis rufescens]